MADLEEAEIEIVETPIEGDVVDQEEAPEQEVQEDDERLAEREDDDEPVNPKAAERKRRRIARKRAEEHLRSENAFMLDYTAKLEERVRLLEGNSLASSEQRIDTQIAGKLREVQQAEAIMAAAANEGNGEDMVRAMSFRDSARDELRALQGQKDRLSTTRQEAQKAPQPSAAVAAHAARWLADNKDWYDPSLGNEESRRAREIDRQILQEGYKPETAAYWAELDRRCEALFEKAPPRRQAPPTAMARGDGTARSAKQVYLSPERVAAIKQAGMWDDPKQRMEMVKAYQEHDRQHAAR